MAREVYQPLKDTHQQVATSFPQISSTIPEHSEPPCAITEHCAGEVSDNADTQDSFIRRFEQLRPRIEQIVCRKWGEDLDPFERDNLVQAAFVHLWIGYERDPSLFDERDDRFWYGVAKRGASNEHFREFRQRFCQKGTGSHAHRLYHEVVTNAGDLLANRMSRIDKDDGEVDDPDETILAEGIIYSHDAEPYVQVDYLLDIRQLIHQIHHGTEPQDHPLINHILAWMQEGLTFSEMARREGVKLATIKGAVRRIREACGGLQAAKENKRHNYGISKDDHIQRLLARGVKPPEIARLIGTDHAFVYRRLRALDLVS